MAHADELVRRLTDDEPRVRLEAVLEAAEPSDAAVSPSLIAAIERRLDDEHPGVAQAALESLTRIIDAERATVSMAALDRALALAGHESPLVRREAIAALGVFCPEVDRPERSARLLSALKDGDLGVRCTAAAACGDLRLQAAREPLAALLSDRKLKFEAAFALAALEDPRAAPALQAALRSTSTRLDALEGLRRLRAPETRPALRALTDAWLTPWVDRLSAWATLYLLDDPDAAPNLVARASSRRMEERVYALYLLGHYQVSEGRSLVGQVAADRTHLERETALEALGGYGDEEAAALLIEIAEDLGEDRETRVAAIRALRRIRRPDADRALERLALDPDPTIKAAAGSDGLRPH